MAFWSRPRPRSRCPRCDEVTLPFCVQYAPTPEQGIDWAREVFVVCACGWGYPIVAADVVTGQEAGVAGPNFEDR